MWSVEFLNDKVRDEFDAIPLDLNQRLSKLINFIQIYGANLGEPHTKSIGDGLFEIRAKSKSGIAKSVYCYEVGKRIIILLTFIKKSDKTPKSMLEIAKQRLKEYKNEND